MLSAWPTVGPELKRESPPPVNTKRTGPRRQPSSWQPALRAGSAPPTGHTLGVHQACVAQLSSVQASSSPFSVAQSTV